VQDPQQLYTVEGDLPELDRPVLVYGLAGFIDAGRATRRAQGELLDELEHRVLVRFDADQLIDYRSWRPQIGFDRDHYMEYQTPTIELSAVWDTDGTPFLLLSGREPDVQWERFVAAVEQLVRRFDVGLSVEMHAVPMSVPHTRPVSFTSHGNRADLVAAVRSWKHSVVIPASVGALLEYRLGAAGHDTFGLAAHVPHYLAEGEYPLAAAALLETLGGTCGLSLPSESLRELADGARTQIDEQVVQSDELGTMVGLLEQQYDAWVRAEARQTLLGVDGDVDDMTDEAVDDLARDLPTADELAREFEQFLAERDKSGED